MIYKYNKSLVRNAQELRKNMTSEEKHLWYDFLKHLPVTVNRQKNIENYIVDFFIARGRVVIELDGAQHELPGEREKDRMRDLTLQGMGITVLRYSNKDIRENFNAVCDDILRVLGITADTLRWE